MSKPFEGVTNVDIRDSVPDWAPFEPTKAPDGAPSVLYLVLDDVGCSWTATTQCAAAVGHAGTRMSAHCYRVVVEEEFRPRYAPALCGMTLSAHDDRTGITAPIVGWSHLHGLLERIADLGGALHSLARLIPRTRGLMRRRIPNQSGSSTTTLAQDEKGPT